IMMIRPGVTKPPVVESSTIQYDGCFVGRFHKQKGIPELLQIWKEVCRTKKDAKLAIIGRGEQVWQDLIKNFIKNNQLDENIVMLGFQDGLEKIKVMQMSRVFLFPSNYESFGIVGLEALACGIPVVSFDLDVFKEIFGDVFTMVRTGDIEAFANKVIALLDDNELLARKKSSGLAFAQLYDWSHGANEVLAEFISKDQ
ncbi:MAG: glycosyltransferase, partial [Smithellaceae bacterium]|nr:glycosyltransferase [Smithellaceae bacterium]